jgi:redox-sensing transcriptional repressor
VTPSSEIWALASEVRTLAVDIAVLAIPADDAQPWSTDLVTAGVRAILNFAPAQVHVPTHVPLNTSTWRWSSKGFRSR